jgi:hypothetical protein
MGKVVKGIGKGVGSLGKTVGHAIGLGGAGSVQNGEHLNMNFGQQMADRSQGQQQFLGQQQQLTNQLMQQAQGQGPSIAQAQLQQGTDQNIAQQMAMASSARGGNVGMAQRQAAMNAGQAQQQMAGQAGVLRLQEQQGAQQQLGQNLNSFQGGIDNYNQGMIGLANQRDMGQQAANAQGGKMFGDFLSKGSEAMSKAAMAGSDENIKENVKPAGKKIESFLDALGAHEYSYKPEAKGSPINGEGRHVSPMAQEIESTELGKGMVKDTPGGKVVDYGKGFGVMMAAMSEMHDRMKKLEGKKKNG